MPARPAMPPAVLPPDPGRPGMVMPPGTALPAPGNAFPTLPSVNNAAPASPLASNAAIPSLVGAAPEAGSGAVESAAPNMIGDFGIGAAGQLRGVSRTQRVPLVTRGGIKITENESPRPQDRIFFNYNYFNNVTVYETAPFRRQQPGISGQPGGPPSHFDLHRETFGFEKTLFNRDASIGLRVPILQKDGLGGVSADGFGDLTIVTKYAFYDDRQSGNVISGGLVVTVPTGRSIILANGDRLDAVLLQPWLGFLVNSDRFYALGFTAVITSTDERDVTFATADLGIGYRLYTAADDSVITSLVPTLEAHANIPLNHSGISSGGTIVFPDQFILTGGVHVGLGCRTTFTLGTALPITGPKPYDFELLCQLNVRF
jgi:hypothetical protein